MKHFKFLTYKMLALCAMLLGTLSAMAAGDDYYPPYIYIDGMVNGADNWQVYSYYDAKHVKVPHSGNGVYYALLIRPGGTQVKIDGTLAEAHGSDGGGRFRITWPDVDANGKQYTVTDNNTTHIKTICFCATTDQELTQGVALTKGLERRNPAEKRQSFFVKENQISDYRTRRIFMVKIDLKNKSIEWIADNDSENNKPHTWWVAHTGSSRAQSDANKEYNDDNFEKGNGGLGHYDFTEPMLETSPGVFEAKYVWLPQIATKNSDGSLTWNKSYFRITAIPSFRTSYASAWSMSASNLTEADRKYRYVPSLSDCDVNHDFQFRPDAMTANAAHDGGNVFKIQADETANELNRGYYNITLNTNNNTVTLSKGIPENIWIFGTVNDMDGWGYKNGWTRAKLDKGEDGIFYGTIRRNNELGYTFTFTDRNAATGSQKLSELFQHRINGGTPSQPITITDAGTEAVCKGDVDLSNSSYQIQNAGINYAYAKVDMNNDKVTFSTTPNLLFINHGGGITQMEKVENGWRGTITPTNNQLQFNFCTMSSEPDQDLFGPASNTNLNLYTSTQMVAHTAGGKYTVTLPATAQNINYDVFVTIEGSAYKVYVGPSAFYVVGNSEQKVVAGTNWTWNDNTRPLKMVAPGIYKGTHVYLPAEYYKVKENGVDVVKTWTSSDVWSGSNWKPRTHFWFTASPNGYSDATQYALRPNEKNDQQDGNIKDVTFMEFSHELTTKALNQPFYIQKDSKNYKVYIAFPGHYDITIDMNTGQVNLQRTVPETLYVKGANIQNNVPLYSVGNGHFVGVINTLDANFTSGATFHFEDEQGHYYGPGSANTELTSANIGNKFLFSEKTHLLDNNDAGGGGSYKIMDGFNGAIYVDCDFNARTTTFSTTPLVMGVVFNGKVTPMVKEGDGKFHLRNCTNSGFFFFTTRMDKVEGPIKNYFGTSSTETVQSGVEYTASPSNSGSFCHAFTTYDIMFDPATNKVVATDLSKADAVGGKIILASTTRTTFRNPISEEDMADPTIVRDDDGKFHAFGTGGKHYTSSDLVHFKYEGKLTAMHTQGQAAKDYFTSHSISDNETFWAPDVTRLGTNKYVAFYSVSNSGGLYSAIGVKTATDPAGTWTDQDNLLLASDADKSDIYNCIDAQLFIDSDGRKYVVDGSYDYNKGSANGWGIHIIELNDACTAVKAGDMGKNSKVRIAKGSFEGSYIYKRDGWYYYFGSCGYYNAKENSTAPVTKLYRVIVARSKNLYGPYVLQNGKALMDFDFHGVPSSDADFRDLGTPFLYSNVVNTNQRGRFVAPGHNGEIITDDEGKDWMIYHGFDTNDYDAGRKLFMDQVVWQDGWPRIYWKDPDTGVEHYGEPSYKNVEGPVFYPINEGAALAPDAGAYKASDVAIQSGDPDLVRVFQTRPDNWSSEWNMFYKSYGAQALNTSYLKDKAPSNMAEASTAVSSFTTSSGVYDVEVNGALSSLKLTRKTADYPEKLYMIGNMNTKYGQDSPSYPGWVASYHNPILMFQNATNKNLYYTDIFIHSKDIEVTFAFTTIKTLDDNLRNAKRYGPTSRHYDFTADGTLASFTTACIPDATANENCYRMNSKSDANQSHKFARGVYHVTVDLASGQVTLTPKDATHQYPGGLYLIHGATAITTSEGGTEVCDWNFTSTDCHMLKQTSKAGVYEAKGVILPMERKNNKRCYFAIASASSTTGNNRDAFWGTAYGATDNVYSYDDVVTKETAWGNHWMDDGAKLTQPRTCTIQQTCSFFSAVPGIYDLTVDLTTNNFTLTPSTTYPENLYIVGNCDYVKRDAKGAGRIKMYNAGGGKYYGLINVADGEEGTFMFTTTQSDGEQEMACCTFGSDAPETSIARNETKSLNGVSRYFTKHYNQSAWKYGYHSDFSFKVPATGKYYAEVDLAAGTLKLSDKPSVLYITRSYSNEEAKDIPQDWFWWFNGEQGALVKVDGSDYDLRGEDIYMPKEHGKTNCYYSLTSIAVPTIYSNATAWKMVKTDRWGNGITDAKSSGTWSNVVNILSQGADQYKDTSEGTFHFVFNTLTNSLVRLDVKDGSGKPKDYTGVCLLNLHKGTGNSDEGFVSVTEPTFDMRGWMAKKFDDNTYYFETLYHTPRTLKKEGDNKCRFTFLIDGKYQLCADAGTVLEPTANATDEWKTAHIGREASKGLFTLNGSTPYYGLTVKKVSDTEWKVAANTQNLELQTTKCDPSLNGNLIIQPERISWTAPSGVSTTDFVVINNAATPVENTSLTLNSNPADVYGLYSTGVANDASAGIRVTYTNGVEQIALKGLSHIADVKSFPSEGTLTVQNGKVFDASARQYGANLAWNYTTAPSVNPSYYTISVKDVLDNNEECNTSLDASIGTKIPGGTARAIALSDAKRALYVNGINDLKTQTNGQSNLAYSLIPQYELYDPQEVTLYNIAKKGNTVIEGNPLNTAANVEFPNYHTVSIGTAKWATYAPPFNVSPNFEAENKSAVKVYYITGTQKESGVDRVTTVEVAAESAPVKALKGLLLYSNDPQDVKFLYSNNTPQELSDNLLVGTDQQRIKPDDEGTTYKAYILGRKSDGIVKFYHWGTAKLGAYKAYLKIDGISGAPEFYNLEDLETDIDKLNESNQEDEVIYNLSGQRIQHKQRGVNIVNGKKVLY